MRISMVPLWALEAVWRVIVEVVEELQ